VVARLAQRHQQEYLLLINLVSKYAKQDGDKPDMPKAPDEPAPAPWVFPARTD
jgi:hypothetical protein